MVSNNSNDKDSSSRLSLSAKFAAGGVTFLLALGSIPVIGQPMLQALGSESAEEAVEQTVEQAAEEAPAIEETPVVEDSPSIEEPAYEGKHLVDRYLAGEELTYDQLLTIDLDAVRALDADLADELAALLESLAPAEGGEGEDVPGLPGDGTDAPGGEDATDPAPEAPEGSATDEDSSATQPDDATEPEDLSSLYPAWDYQGDTSFTMIHYTDDLTTSKFIAAISEQARQVAQEHDLYASVMIAQAVIESQSGTAVQAATPNNNLFNMKGLQNGAAVIPALEDVVPMDAGAPTYRTYGTMMESMEDYAQQITHDFAFHFGQPLKSTTTSWQEAAAVMQEKYAADPTYADAIGNIINDYDLTRYDAPLPYATTQPIQKRVFDPETREYVNEECTLPELMAEATSHLGTPYLWGGSNPEVGLDCSGFVQLSYRNALGLELPRTSYYQCTQGEDVDFADLHMGDLLFFVDTNNTVGHVAMYLGDGYYIESTTRTHCNAITSMDENRPDFAKRIIPSRDISDEELAAAL